MFKVTLIKSTKQSPVLINIVKDNGITTSKYKNIAKNRNKMVKISAKVKKLKFG